MQNRPLEQSFMSKEIQVLFFDDDDNSLYEISNIFHEETFGVLTASSLEKAMEILRKETIKVVVCGARMKEIEGVKFLQNVRGLHPDTVRILLASSNDFASAEDAINMGEVYRFISKPWKKTELLSNIRRAIEHYDLIVRAEQTNLRLKAMYDVQREFTSTVSHELRTPLASIKTAIDLVVMKTLGDINKEQAEVLRRAKRNVDRLKRLIDDILDLTKMESGKLQMNFMLNDINRSIKDVFEAQKDVARNRNLYVKTQLDTHIPHIKFDSDRIVQVVNNLVGNAIKFTKVGGITIKTNLNSKEQCVLISVVDTGKGIAEEDITKLFQKFHQIESAEANEEGGTGLGLAISKEIIARHKGSIWVESVFGEGTTFHFTLPLPEEI